MEGAAKARPTKTLSSGIVDQVQGPISLSEHYSAKWNKRIYIFGDKHVRTGKCEPLGATKKRQDIVKFIQTIIKANRDKVLDFFMEYEFISKHIGTKRKAHRFTLRDTKNAFITDIMVQYQKCFRIAKTACQYKNLRFHYVDVRFAGSLGTQLFNLLNSFDKDDWKAFVSKNRDFINQFPLSETAITQFMKLTKIPKQLNAITDTRIQSAIVKWGKAKMQKYKKLVPKDWNALHTQKQRDVAFINIIHTMALFMDLYLLARMFRSFRQVRGKYSADPKYIIIYVGDGHADRYREFLKTLEFKTVHIVHDSERYPQCLDITKFKQPFFSN